MNGYDLIIPVFKEKKIIKLIDYIFINSKNFNNIFLCYDDDNDITLKILKESHYISNKKIILVKNLLTGPCEAVKTGIQKSNTNSVIVYPADDYNNGLLLDKMHKLFNEGYDVVCPSRFIKGGAIKNCPFIKLLIVKIVSFCLYYLSSLNIKDPTNGFRLFSKQLIDKHFIESKKGFAYSLELLIKAKKYNLRIIEIPAIWIERKDRKSSFKIIEWSRDYLKWFLLAIFR